jgi:hypothetical protein
LKESASLAESSNFSSSCITAASVCFDTKNVKRWFSLLNRIISSFRAGFNSLCKKIQKFQVRATKKLDLQMGSH